MKNARTGLLQSLMTILKKELKTKEPTRSRSSSGRQYNRREFINQTAKGTVGISLALSFPTLLSSCVDTRSGKGDLLDIAILGGGIAGLNCANYLLSSGLNFKVFEANKRVGGRILTHYNDALEVGVFPEFGGDFIDTNHEDMLNLAKEFNLELLDLEAEREAKNLEMDLYFFEGKKRTEAEIIQEFKKVSQRIADDIASLGDDYDTPEAKALDNMPLSKYINSLQCANWLKELLVAAFIAEYGLDCEDQSTINMLDMLDTDVSDGFKVFGDSDERYRIKGGNSKIIEGLEKKIGKDKIALNYEVKKIVEHDDGTYTISFTNDEEIQARSIVCTIPFTILRKLELDLKNMPTEKRNCIDELGYGMNTKVLLAYEGTPWTEGTHKSMGYLFHKEIVNGWDSSYNKKEGNTKGVYVAYFGGAYSVELNEQSSKHPLAPPTHVWKTELPQDRIDHFVNQLDEVFVGSKEKFLGKHVFVNWIDFPYTRASYTCYKVGQWTSISGWEMEPVGHFFFAGEHCSVDFQGFMNGAAETGRRVASMVLEAVKQGANS